MSGTKSCKVAVLATDGFELAELIEPVKALRAAGATVKVISPHGGEIQGMNHHQKGEKISVDLELSRADPKDFDALLLPGGVANPDELRTDQHAISFVKDFADANKPIAAICHGPWTLIEAGAVRGKMMTSWPSLQTDLRNAGAIWFDQEVVIDGQLVTSRKPGDLYAFNHEFLKLLMGIGQASSHTAS
jgi:protease I